LRILKTEVPLFLEDCFHSPRPWIEVLHVAARGDAVVVLIGISEDFSTFERPFGWAHGTPGWPPSIRNARPVQAFSDFKASHILAAQTVPAFQQESFPEVAPFFYIDDIDQLWDLAMFRLPSQIGTRRHCLSFYSPLLWLDEVLSWNQNRLTETRPPFPK